MEAYKIRTPDQETWIESQKCLLELGYEWKNELTSSGISLNYSRFLYAENDGRLMFGSKEDTFQKDFNKEITLTDLKIICGHLSSRPQTVFNEAW